MDNLKKQFIRVGDIELHVVTAGDENGTPILLLHGFPEFWYGWRKQIEFLAANGYYVIVPDQRGYNLSDKPRGKSQYTLNILAQDVANLIDAMGYEKINLVGHDWGGVISWVVAETYPEKLERLVVLNAPVPNVMIGQLMQGNFNQMVKSLYMGFFQLPLIPETLMSLNGYDDFAKGLQANATEGAFTDEDMKAYQRAWSQPNAMTSMLNYYRAMTSPSQAGNARKKAKITVPTLMLWGEKDVALGKELARPSIEQCVDGELVFFPNATHWIQHDEPDSVNEEIHKFIAQEVGTPTI
ncbi:MAG: alpha/beta hydrolase [Phototrophicaceae bacterium]